MESRLLISKISLKDKSTYKPSNPEIFREIFNLKVLEVEEFIKESKKILNEPTKEKTKFYTSDNVHIFWEFISEALNKKSEILIYGYSESMQEDIPKEIREKLMKERVNNKIPVRVLTDDFSKEKLINFNKLSFTKAKNIPLQIKDKNGFMRIISGNKVYLVFWEQPVKTIIIENESLAEHHRKLFDILWNL